MIPAALDRWLESPDREVHLALRPVRFSARLLIRSVQQLLRDRAPLMAAAITYRTVFALVPVLIVSLVVLRFFIGTEAISSGVGSLLDQLGLTDLSIQSAEAAPQPGDESGTNNAADAEDAAPATVAEWIESLIARVEDVNFGAIGAVGAAILIYAALSLLMQVEQCFNVIYAAPAARKLSTRLTTYWTMLTLGPIGIVASLTLGSRLGDAIQPEGLSAGVTDALLSLAISWLILLAAFTLIPNTRVKLRPAAIGAIMAAVLFELGKHAFRSYLGFSTGYAKLYGSLGLVPVFFLWVYLTWFIVLFGLEIARALQILTDDSPHADPSAEPPADPACALAMLVAGASRFQRGEPFELDDAAVAAGVTPRHAESILKKLADHGFVHAVESPDEEPRFTLAREPASLDAAQVARAVSPEGDSAAAAIRDLIVARHEGITIKDLRDKTNHQDAGASQPSEEAGDSPSP